MMSKAPDTVSIALCTFNGGLYLSAQLDSFLLQNRLPDELVVSDDCSTDETIEILEAFQQKAPFSVRIFRNASNVGYAKNFEQTLLRCAGETIFPSDQDDVWRPEKIERLTDVCNQNQDVQMVVSNAELVDGALEAMPRDLFDLLGLERSQIGVLQNNPLERLLFGRNFVSGNTLAIRASLCNQLNKHPIPRGSAHDHWLGVLAALGSGLRLVDYKGIKYRQHQAQVYGLGIIKTPERKAGSPRQRYDSVREIAQDQCSSYESLLSEYDAKARKENSTQELARQINKNRELISRKISELRNQAVHFRLRGELAESRLSRVPDVVRELTTGRYGKYSGGVKSAIFDLIRTS